MREYFKHEPVRHVRRTGKQDNTFICSWTELNLVFFNEFHKVHLPFPINFDVAEKKKRPREEFLDDTLDEEREQTEFLDDEFEEDEVDS